MNEFNIHAYSDKNCPHNFEQSIFSEDIWRRNAGQNPTYNSSSNISQIYAYFLSYFQKSGRSRQHQSMISPGVIEISTAAVLTAFSPLMVYLYPTRNFNSRNCPKVIPIKFCWSHLIILKEVWGYFLIYTHNRFCFCCAKSFTNYML